MYIEIDELRDIILGKIQFRKCPDCLGKGITMYNCETGNDWPDQSQDTGEVEQILDLDYCEAGCENCEGLGYIEIPN